MIELRSKAMFFDRAAVTGAMDKARFAVLSKFGAFVRRRAKSSIRRRKRSSSPGQPPSSHVGKLRDLLFFVFDPQTKSVVIGPEKFGNTGAPATLEFGGVSTINVTGTGIAHAGMARQSRTVSYEARPFMGPAFEAETAALPSLFLDQVAR